MKIQSVLLLRVSSHVDKEVDHPQFFDPPYPLKYLQVGLKTYPDLKIDLLDCWIRPMGVERMLDYSAGIRPDLVVISASSFDVDVANQYVATLKAHKGQPDWAGITRLIQEWQPAVLVVGAPRHADGTANAVTTAALDFSRQLHHRYRREVATIDERLSSPFHLHLRFYRG